MTALPGGLIRAQQRRRDYRLVRPSGGSELELHDRLATASSHPGWISEALALVLDELAGEPPTPEAVAQLAVADRQFLAVQWRLHSSSRPDQPAWFSADCTACEAPYDFPLDWCELPVKEAGPTYPWARVALSIGQAELRVPNGAVQTGLASLPDSVDARLWLARRLIRMLDDRPVEDPDTLDLTGPDIDAIEGAAESVSPELGLVLETRCPECGAGQRVELDPYANLVRPVDGLLREVHRLARHYHWSESEILTLPSARRRHYLKLIDAERGLAGQEADR